MADTMLQQLAKTDRNPVQETKYQELLKQQGSASGGANYDALLGQVNNATSNFAGKLNQQENNAFTDYLNLVQGQPKSVDFYSQISDQMGIPKLRESASTLQGQIYNTEDLLRRIEPDVSATTRNSMVTEAQRRGIVQSRSEPLQEQLGWLGQSLGRVSDAITKTQDQAILLTNLNSQDQAKVVDAYKTKLDLASRQGDRALQAFSQDINNVLNVTLAKIARGEAVDDREAGFAHDLLMLEKQAEQQMKQLQFQVDNREEQDQGLISVGEGTSLFDPKTGQVMYTAPKTNKPESGASEGAWS